MYIYKNGDRCPCCGTVLADKTEEQLAELSENIAALEWLGIRFPFPAKAYKDNT